MEKKVVMLLAARAAEIEILKSPSAGAAGDPRSDLAIATRVVTSIHASLGLRESLVFRWASDKTESIIEYDTGLRVIVEKDLQRLHGIAKDLMRRHRRGVETIADALIARRWLTGAEIEKMFARSPAVTTDGQDDQLRSGRPDPRH